MTPVLCLRGGAHGNSESESGSCSNESGAVASTTIDDRKSFVCILKNVRSFLSQERFEELLEEANCIDWDVLLINETWR
eukprot:7831501-Karenia_brevis.AAC.1